MSGRLDRRRYAREYARRKRAAKLAQELRTAPRCPKHYGRNPCGARLTADVDKITGRTIVVCEACDRTARGICLDCSLPVAGKSPLARRCARHKAEARTRQVRASEARNIEKRRAASRRAYQENPEARARKNEYKRAWRKANPDKVRAQKRRAALRQPKRVYHYMARYRKKHREHYRQEGRARYYREHPRTPAPKCRDCGKSTRWKPLPGGRAGRRWTRCNACVPPCVRKERLARRRRARRELAKLAATRKSVKLVVPKGRKLAPNGDRLCLGVGCSTVVAGRTKKCDACKARDAEVAALVLAQSKGRGRRTDLERRERAA